MRLARREVRRRPGRTALVALLVALPVAAMVLAAVLIRTDFVGPDGQWVRYNGQADLRTQSDLEPQALDLPAGSRQIEIRGSFLTVTSEDVVGATADGDDRQRVMLEVSDAPLLDPITSGMFDLLDGRSPAAAGEIVMSPRVLDRLDAEIGDEIEISSVGRLAIVGTVEQPSCLACDTAIVAPGSLGLAQGWMDNGVRVLVDLPDSVTGAELQQMVDEGEGLVSARGIPEPFESTDEIGRAHV